MVPRRRRAARECRLHADRYLDGAVHPGTDAQAHRGPGRNAAQSGHGGGGRQHGWLARRRGPVAGALRRSPACTYRSGAREAVSGRALGSDPRAATQRCVALCHQRGARPRGSSVAERPDGPGRRALHAAVPGAGVGSDRRAISGLLGSDRPSVTVHVGRTTLEERIEAWSVQLERRGWSSAIASDISGASTASVAPRSRG